MIPGMHRLLERIRSERGEKEFLANPVMPVHECQGAINSACKSLGITRFTHHDLRHLFATRCTESGVEIPTVSLWLGHKDGGALAMKTYGHLRDQNSANMAQKVIFSEAQPKVALVPSPSTDAQNGHAVAVNRLCLTNLNITVSFLPTNALSSWPLAARTPGGAAQVNSNGTIYMLVSGPGSTTWTKTNYVTGP